MLYIVLYAYETLKMNVTCSSEMSVNFYWTTRHYIPGDRTLPVGYGQNWKASGFHTIFNFTGISHNINTAEKISY